MTSLNANRLADVSHDVNLSVLPLLALFLPPPDFPTAVSVTCALIMVEVARGREVVMMRHSHGTVVGCEASRGIKIKK